MLDGLVRRHSLGYMSAVTEISEFCNGVGLAHVRNLRRESAICVLRDDPSTDMVSVGIPGRNYPTNIFPFPVGIYRGQVPPSPPPAVFPFLPHTSLQVPSNPPLHSSGISQTSVYTVGTPIKSSEHPPSPPPPRPESCWLQWCDAWAGARLVIFVIFQTT